MHTYHSSFAKSLPAVEVLQARQVIHRGPQSLSLEILSRCMVL